MGRSGIVFGVVLALGGGTGTVEIAGIITAVAVLLLAIAAMRSERARAAARGAQLEAERLAWEEEEAARATHRRRVRDTAVAELRDFFGRLDPELRRAIDDGAPATMATVDYLVGVLWAWQAADDRVLDALTFASANPDLPLDETIFAAKRALETAGGTARMMGYVGEQVAACELADLGYIVEWPDSPTQVGWDLLVDGQPLQVKTTLETSAIRAALQDHPDIPVLAPFELADSSLATDNVLFLPGFEHEGVQEIAQSGLSEVAGIGDGVHLPVFTLALLGHRSYRSFRSGQSLQSVAVRFAGEATAVTGGTIVGGATGMALGSAAAAAGFGGAAGWASSVALGSTIAATVGTKYGIALGTATALLLGPAGALAVAALGTYGGAKAGQVLGRKLSQWWTFRGVPEGAQRLVRHADRCRTHLRTAIGRRGEAVSRKRKSVGTRLVMSAAGEVEELLRRKLDRLWARRAEQLSRQRATMAAPLTVAQEASNTGAIESALAAVVRVQAWLEATQVLSPELAKATRDLGKSAEEFVALLRRRGLIER